MRSQRRPSAWVSKGLCVGGLGKLQASSTASIPLTWNPACDGLIEKTYSAASLSRRKANRRAVEERFGLDSDDSMLLAVVSRLTWQKGMDMLADAIAMLPVGRVKLAVLGSGEKPLETRLAKRGRGTTGPGRLDRRL